MINLKCILLVQTYIRKSYFQVIEVYDLSMFEQKKYQQRMSFTKRVNTYYNIKCTF